MRDLSVMEIEAVSGGSWLSSLLNGMGEAVSTFFNRVGEGIANFFRDAAASPSGPVPAPSDQGRLTTFVQECISGGGAINYNQQNASLHFTGSAGGFGMKFEGGTFVLSCVYQ